MSQHTPIAEAIAQAMRRVVALELWHLEAVKVDLEKPFRLASGNFSPIYINCRQLISAPAFADLLAASARILCQQRGIQFDVLAGGETAGIPVAAFLAKSFGLPMIYVRKEAKAYGMASRIEGVLPQGATVLLVEDLITDAGSKLSFVNGIREAGGQVYDVLVIFDRLQGGQAALAREGIRLHCLADIEDVLRVAAEVSLLTGDQLDSLRRYFEDPAAWHQQRGLAFKTPGA